MRGMMLTVCAVLLYMSSHAQFSSYVLGIIEKDADKAAAEQLEKEKALHPGMSEVAQKFTLDTCHINFMWQKKLEFVLSGGREQFAREALYAYDDLMLKWYDIIMKKLNEKDKAELVALQKQWKASYEQIDTKYPEDKYPPLDVYKYKVAVVKERAVQMFQFAQTLK